MSPDEAAAALERLADALPGTVRAVVDETADEALRLAREYSSGTTSLADLRREGHPYARRHGSPQRRADLINAQSRAFLESWRQEPAGDELAETVIHNVAPHARYLYDLRASSYFDGGTERMFGRPVPDRVMDELEPRFETDTDAALGRLFDALG